MQQKSEYDQLIRDAIDFRLVQDFAFGRIRFEWVYAFPYVTIVDRINQLYLEACEDSERGYHYHPYDMSRDPFRMVNGEVKFEYGTSYIANIVYHIANYYVFKYDVCMKCPECTEYWCEMEREEILQCMQRREDKYWADAAAPSWDD